MNKDTQYLTKKGFTPTPILVLLHCVFFIPRLLCVPSPNNETSLLFNNATKIPYKNRCRGFTPTPFRGLFCFFKNISIRGDNLSATNHLSSRIFPQNKKLYPERCRGFTPTPFRGLFCFFKNISIRGDNLSATNHLSSRIFPQNKKLYPERCRGFTLIELLLTISLFIFMTSIVLAKYRSFSINSVFANAVEGVVLSLREAQVYGAGTKGVGVSSFNVPYGVYFVANSSQIIVFADSNSNGLYSLTDTLIETIRWQSNIRISFSGITCDTTNSISYLGVTFSRPNPDAIITRGDLTKCVTATITITDSNTNRTALVSINNAGQISMQ